MCIHSSKGGMLRNLLPNVGHYCLLLHHYLSRCKNWGYWDQPSKLINVSQIGIKIRGYIRICVTAKPIFCLLPSFPAGQWQRGKEKQEGRGISMKVRSWEAGDRICGLSPQAQSESSNKQQREKSPREQPSANTPLGTF